MPKRLPFALGCATALSVLIAATPSYAADAPSTRKLPAVPPLAQPAKPNPDNIEAMPIRRVTLASLGGPVDLGTRSVTVPIVLLPEQRSMANILAELAPEPETAPDLTLAISVASKVDAPNDVDPPKKELAALLPPITLQSTTEPVILDEHPQIFAEVPEPAPDAVLGTARLIKIETSPLQAPVKLALNIDPTIKIDSTVPEGESSALALIEPRPRPAEIVATVHEAPKPPARAKKARASEPTFQLRR